MIELLTFDACILQVNILFVDELFFDCSRETEEFMKAAYKDDDSPEKLSEQAINTCNALKARTKVRCSSNQLETKAPAAPEPASGGNMDFLKQWVQMAKELDGHSHAEVTRGSLHNSSSSQCLQSKPSNELLSLPCLDPAPVEPGSPLEQPDPIEKQKLLVEKTKSLADFEQEAFDRLQARQSGGKGKNKGKGKGKGKKSKNNTTEGKGDCKQNACKSKAKEEDKLPMKRPAACNSTPKAKPKKTCWGCTRCRGAVGGCSSCDFEKALLV